MEYTGTCDAFSSYQNIEAKMQGQITEGYTDQQLDDDGLLRQHLKQQTTDRMAGPKILTKMKTNKGSQKATKKF